MSWNPFSDPVKNMEKQLFNLKMTAKTLIRESKKSEKLDKENKKKCKKAMEKGNWDGARIYAQNAIREKNQALNYLKLSSRIDAVAARVNTAVKMGRLTKDMTSVVKNMDSAMKSMDIEKVTKVMDKFEQQFEDLDLNSQYMEQAMDASTANTMPQSDVDGLIQQIADENNLEFQSELDQVGIGKSKPEAKQEVKEEDDLAERLARLKDL